MAPPPVAAEPLTGSTADAPKPYDPKSVKSVVRWGTQSGKYMEQTEGQDSLVYTYRYPQSEACRGREGHGWECNSALPARHLATLPDVQVRACCATTGVDRPGDMGWGGGGPLMCTPSDSMCCCSSLGSVLCLRPLLLLAATADLTYNQTDIAEVYHSPILHHVLLKGLDPGSTYFYSVGE